MPGVGGCGWRCPFLSNDRIKMRVGTSHVHCAGEGKVRHAVDVLQATSGVSRDCHCLRKPPQE